MITKEQENVINVHETLLKYTPNNYILHGNLGRLYGETYKYGHKRDQMFHISRAYEIEPENDVNLLNLFLILYKFNSPEVPEIWEKVSKLEYNPGIWYTYGKYLIRNKKLKEGLEYYRHRFEFEPEILPEGLHDRWEPGIDISDKTILISYEQGFGDTFMFIRFVDQIKPMCKELKLLVQPEVYDLIKYNYNYEIYTDKDIPNIEYDYFIPMLDTMSLIDIDLDNIPGKEGYLKAPHGEKTDTYKIGIAFEGHEKGKELCRDIPLEKLYPIMKLPNVQIYSLQKDDTENQLDNVPEDINLIKLGHTFNNWMDTAKAVMDMDLIITTDNAVLNLAGALGKKTFALFNEYPDFRWYDLSKDIGWYNIKPYQCKEFDAWDTVIENVIKDINIF